MYLDYRYFDENAAQTAIGRAISCVSGRTAVYRRHLLLRVGDDFMAETFLGRPCMSGDDKRLTSLLLAAGYDCVLQRTARVWSTFPGSYRQFLKQRLRWARNTWRSDLRALALERWAWRRPFLAFTMVDKAVSSFTLLAAPTFMVVGLVRQDWLFVALLAGWWWLSRSIKLLPHLRRRPSSLVLVPPFVLLSFVMAVVKLYALATVRTQRWLTRDVEVVGDTVVRTGARAPPRHDHRHRPAAPHGDGRSTSARTRRRCSCPRPSVTRSGSSAHEADACGPPSPPPPRPSPPRSPPPRRRPRCDPDAVPVPQGLGTGRVLLVRPARVDVVEGGVVRRVVPLPAASTSPAPGDRRRRAVRVAAAAGRRPAGRDARAAPGLRASSPRRPASPSCGWGPRAAARHPRDAGARRRQSSTPPPPAACCPAARSRSAATRRCATRTGPRSGCPAPWSAGRPTWGRRRRRSCRPTAGRRCAPSARALSGGGEAGLRLADAGESALTDVVVEAAQGNGLDVVGGRALDLTRVTSRDHGGTGVALREARPAAGAGRPARHRQPGRRRRPAEPARRPARRALDRGQLRARRAAPLLAGRRPHPASAPATTSPASASPAAPTSTSSTSRPAAPPPASRSRTPAGSTRTARGSPGRARTASPSPAARWRWPTSASRAPARASSSRPARRR
jgi:hypothetical protein